MKNIYQVLSQLCIDYKKYDHPAVFTVEESKKIKANIPGASTKNLFLRNKKKTNYYLVCLLAEKKVDLKVLAERLNEDRFSFGSPADLKARLDLTPGSVSPFGLINDRANQGKVVVDRDFDKFKQVGFHPNDNQATVVLAVSDFEKFLGQTGNQIIYQDI